MQFQLQLRSLHIPSCSGFSYSRKYTISNICFIEHKTVYIQSDRQEKDDYLGACIPRKMKGIDVITLAAVSKILWSPVNKVGYRNEYQKIETTHWDENKMEGTQ